MSAILSQNKQIGENEQISETSTSTSLTTVRNSEHIADDLLKQFQQYTCTITVRTAPQILMYLIHVPIIFSKTKCRE